MLEKFFLGSRSKGRDQALSITQNENISENVEVGLKPASYPINTFRARFGVLCFDCKNEEFGFEKKELFLLQDGQVSDGALHHSVLAG